MILGDFAAGAGEKQEWWAKRILQRCFVSLVALRGNGTLLVSQAALAQGAASKTAAVCSWAAVATSPNMPVMIVHPFKR